MEADGVVRVGGGGGATEAAAAARKTGEAATAGGEAAATTEREEAAGSECPAAAAELAEAAECGAAEEEGSHEPGLNVLAACNSSSEAKQKLQKLLQQAAVAPDMFWQHLHTYAANTCGGSRKADEVVAAFKTIHAKRLASMNLEQTDALCKDVLALLLQQQ